MREFLARLHRAPEKLAQASSDFDLNPEVHLPANRKLKPAAVLIAIDPAGHVILTRRAAHLKHHAGQIALPGGRQDPEDGSLTATALREAQEEIGLAPKDAQIIGALPNHETVTGYDVTPILALIRPFEMKPEPGEVAEIFRVPLPHLTQKTHFRVERRHWGGDWRRYYVVPWGPYYIWGATARIFRNLAEGMA